MTRNHWRDASGDGFHRNRPLSAQSIKINESLLLSGVRQHELIEATEAMNLRLQASLKEKEYFIAVLSHELRTPLAPVLIAAAMLEQDQRLLPETRSIMEMIHRNITLEVRLIDDLLDNTRMENGKLDLDCRPVAFARSDRALR